MNNLMQHARDYAKFLKIDKQIPEKTGFRLGAFMFIALQCEFYQSPNVWFRQLSKGQMARVYFEPWSQNNMPTLRAFPGKYYYCAIENDVFVCPHPEARTRRQRIFRADWKNSDYSGSRTREIFMVGREHFEWLKKQLAAMS